MQFAERWIGSSMIVAGVLALAPAMYAGALAHHRRHHHHHHHRANLDLAPHGCVEERVRVPAPPPAPPPVPQPESYESVFESAAPAFALCMRGGGTVQLLVKITPEGRVATVTPRPDPETRESRCLERAILPLRFPSGTETVVLRVPFSAP